jgi:hypothetical protein
MRRIFFFYLVVIAMLALGCQGASTTGLNMTGGNTVPTPVPANTSPAQDTHGDDAPRISLADAKAAFDSGEAYFIDTRGAEQYKSEHIKGAVNITASDIAAKMDSLPKGKKIIAYCS